MPAKTLLILSCALLVAAVSPAAEQATTSKVLPPALSAACTRAGIENKTVMLEFFSYNSVESKMLRDNVLTNPAVKELTDKSWVSVSCEMERDPELRKRFGITRAPTLLLLRADGVEIDRLAGYPKPDELVRVLKAAGEGKSVLDDLIATAKQSEAGVDAHLALADAYLKRSRTASAADELLICLDRATAHGPDRKYLKIVLSRLAILAPTNPPALETMRTRRDTLEKAETPKPDDVQVLFAFNEALKEPERSVDFYLRLSVDNPLRQQLFGSIFLQLVETQHYAEAMGTIDLETYVNNAYLRQNAGLTHDEEGHGHSEAAHERMEKLARERVINLATAAVQAMLATDRLEKAKRIAGRLLETYEGKDARQLLTQAAQRSGAKSASDFSSWIQSTYPPKADTSPTASTTPVAGAARLK